MHPKFTADLIAQLAGRVRAHNEGRTTARVKLTDLKKRYANGFKGESDDTRGTAGLANVDRYLEKLAKADEHFEEDKHPRGRGGKFAAKEKAPIIGALPATLAEHRAMQAASPAYNALTSEIVPEHRNQVIGSWIRNIAMLGGGALLTIPLMRHGGVSSGVANAIRNGGRYAGRYGLSVPTATVLYPAAGLAEHAVAPLARLLRKPLKAGAFYGAADRGTRAAAYVGDRLGRGLGWGLANGAHIVLHSLDEGAGAHPNPVVARARRYALRGGLSALTGALGVNSVLALAPALDPEKIGENVDAFSYRTIEKMAGGAARLDQAVDEVLAKGLAGDPLAKAGFYGALGRGLIPAALGIGAAAAGAGGAEAAHAIIGTRRGNPYRDSHGKFTSSANAVTAGAGLVAGAAGALAIYAAIRRHNFRALTQHVLNAATRIDSHIAAARSEAGTDHVADMIAEAKADAITHTKGRSAAIQERMAGDEAYLAEKKRLQLYAGSHDAHYKARIRHEVNGKLATILSQINEFRVPGEGKPSTWPTIAQVRASAGGSTGKADMAARSAVEKAVDTVSPENFEHAIADLTPAQQDTARHWLSTRSQAIDAVDGQLKAHKDKIEALDAKSKSAETAVSAAKREVDDAKAVADRAGNDVDQHTAMAAYTAALDKHKLAEKAAQKAHDAFMKHQGMASGIVSPVSGHPIPPASDAELAPLHAKARADAEARAAKHVDSRIKAAATAHEKKIAAARADQVAKLHLRGNKLLAAHAMFARRTNVAPGHAIRAVDRAAAAGRHLKKTHDAEMAALRDLIGHQKLHAAVKMAQKGKIPPGMKAEGAADLVSRADDIARDMQNAHYRHVQAQAATAAAEARLGKYAGTFRDRILNPPKGEKVGRVSLPVYRTLLRDVDRASAGARDAAHAFLKGPTGQALTSMAHSVGEHAGKVGSAVYHGGRDVSRALLMRETREGSGEYRIDPTKLLVGSPLAIVASESVRDLYHYGRDHVAHQLGLNDGTQPRAKLPKTIQIEKHIDPVTGGGFVGLSVPDPSGEKGERVILWGEHFKDATSAAKPLHVGGKVSAIRNQAQQQNGQGGGGSRPSLMDIPNLPEDTKKNIRTALGEMKDRMHAVKVEEGHEVRFRPNSDNSKDHLGNEVQKHIEKSLKSGSPSNPRLYHEAIASVVGTHQSQILKQKQAYRLLTGYATGGQKADHAGIFHTGNDSDFAEQNVTKDQVKTALGEEVTRAMTSAPPQGDTQRSNLMRAVAVVGRQKGLADEDLKPLYDRIRNGAPSGDRFSPAPSSPSPRPASERKLDADSRGDDAHGELPNWDQHTLRQASLPHAKRLTEMLQMRGPNDHTDTAATLEATARVLHHSHQLPMHPALRAAANAIADISQNTGPGGTRVARDALRTADVTHFAGVLEAHADKEVERLQRDRVTKLYLDDLPALVKGVVDDAVDAIGHSVADEARAPDGEWTGGGGHAGGGHGGARLAREAVEEGASKEFRSGNEGKPAHGSNYTPAKIATDAGAFVGAEAAGYGAGAAFDTILSRFFPEEAGAVKLLGAVKNAFASGGVGAAAKAGVTGVARGAGKAAASGIGGVTGYAAGGVIGSGVAHGAYSALGAKAPATEGAQLSTGEQVAETLGSIGGGIIGSGFGAAGGPIGTIAGGAAGGYAGSVVGRNIYDVGAAVGKWFGGYDQATAHRAMRRALALPAPKPVPMQGGQSTAPRTPRGLQQQAPREKPMGGMSMA